MIDPATMPERCYTMLKSLNKFDKQEVRGVVGGLLTKTDRDNCFLANYYRGKANVETLLSLKSAKDLQAIAMVARGLFELAVDVELIGAVPGAVSKLVAFSDVEKLRAARKIVQFKAANPAAAVDAAIYDTFITNNAQQIESQRKAIWPDVKKLTHWSGLNLSQRVDLLKAPFDEIYDVEYTMLSWYAHSGLTGFVNLQAQTFNMLAAKQNKLAGDCYVMILTAMIDEFGIEKADAKVKNKLKLAKMLPFTDTPARRKRWNWNYWVDDWLRWFLRYVSLFRDDARCGKLVGPNLIKGDVEAHLERATGGLGLPDMTRWGHNRSYEDGSRNR